MILPEGGLKRIHVDQMAIRRSMREKIELPAIVVYLWDGQEFHGRKVVIQGESTIVQAQKEIASGASVWIETLAAVEIFQ
jgi:hypothetical protein